MVLNELGERLTSALRRLNATGAVDEETFDAVLKDICAALMQSDVNISLVKRLRDNVKTRVNLEEAADGVNKQRLIQQAVLDELVSMLDPAIDPYKMRKGKSNVIMFVGLQGAGKTTTVAKYAHHYRMKGWKVAMVCADTFRAGAFDQLKQNAARVRVPFYGSYSEPDPVKIARDGVAQFRKENYELIIVDTSGRHKQEAALFDEMQQVRAAVTPDEIVFVMDSSIGQAVSDQAAAFDAAVEVGSVIVTKLDGHAKGGGALSAVAATGSPVIFIGTGEHFEDLEKFDARRFIGRLLGMGDIRGLIDTIKDRVGLDGQPEMMERISKGKFTLRDMYDQFQNIMKLGPLSKVMSMLPGNLSQLMGGNGDEEGGKRVKKFMCMMDSMTDAELDGDVQMNDSRIDRVALGSGARIEEVHMLLQSHKQFEKMVGKMGKSGLLKGGDANFAKQMSRNPNAMMQKLAGSIDQRTLQTMGGPQNLMRMMKQMGNMDPSQMQSMLGGMGGGPGGMDMSAMLSALGGGGGAMPPMQPQVKIKHRRR